MKLFPVIVKRIAATSAGFIASVINAGVQLANRFSLVAGSANPAVAIDITRQEFRGPTQAPAVDIDVQGVVGTAASPAHTPAIAIDASLRDAAAANTPQNPAFSFAERGDKSWTTPQTPAVDIDVQGVTGTAVNQVHTPAVDIDASLTNAAATNAPQTPACDIVQVTYNLTRLVGANATADFDTAWSNPGNATGVNDGVFATAVGAVGAKTQTVELSYLNHVDKGELTITAATVRVYMKVTDAVVPLCTVTLSYNLGAGLVNLEAPFTTANGFDNSVTPRVYTIPLTTWTEYNALQVRVKCAFAALAALSNASLDAVTIEIVANKTDAL